MILITALLGFQFVHVVIARDKITVARYLRIPYARRQDCADELEF
jgi:hypothetical protein